MKNFSITQAIAAAGTALLVATSSIAAYDPQPGDLTVRKPDPCIKNKMMNLAVGESATCTDQYGSVEISRQSNGNLRFTIRKTPQP